MKKTIKKIVVFVMCMPAFYAGAQNVFPANGNVGIGTASPTTKLQVFDPNTGSSELLSLKAFYDKLSSPKSLTWRDAFGITGQIDTRFDGTKVSMVFGRLYNSGYQTSDVMTIAGDGTVSIGAVTTKPGYKLFVQQGILTQGILAETVSIGTVTTTPGYKLFVEQGILTEKVKVALKNTTNWSDYVFAENYSLKPLPEVEAFVKKNKHLPGVPSAEQLVKEGGIDVNQMFAKQMEKIEELTLYVIELSKKLAAQSEMIELQSQKTEKLEKENAVLRNAIVNDGK